MSLILARENSRNFVAPPALVSRNVTSDKPAQKFHTDDRYLDLFKSASNWLSKISLVT